jgi:hypothetical protein
MPVPITSFEDIAIKYMSVAKNYSFIYSESPKEVTELCMHKVGE